MIDEPMGSGTSPRESSADGARRLADLPRRIHLLGVGGAGMSGAARILAAHGHDLSGHDRAGSSMLDALHASGIPIDVGASRAELLPPGVELLVRSAAVDVDDPQVAEARRRGVPTWKYAELLPRLAPPSHTLAVAGTHGKTTTAWMLWHALEGLRGSADTAPNAAADAAPNAAADAATGALIGGLSRTLGVNAVAGGGDGWFCAEACEYDRTFLRLEPHGAVITNVEGDHLDYYGTRAAIDEAFARFAARVDVDGLLVLGPDVPRSIENATRAETWRLGRELAVDLLGERRGRFRFRLRGPGWCVPSVQLAVPGEFNVANAALALALAIGVGRRSAGGGAPRAAGLTDRRGLGVPTAGAAAELERFEGAARRFDPWGAVGGVEVVHDYAHHPTEVRVTLEAARRAFPGRPLHVLFQPHQHSRTARFLTELAESLRSADRVVVAAVYGARTHIDGVQTAGAPELVRELGARRVDAEDGGELASALECFADGLAVTAHAKERAAAALVIGAGDIENVRHDLLSELAVRCTAESRSLG